MIKKIEGLSKSSFLIISAHGLKKELPATYRIRAIVKGLEENNFECHLITLDPNDITENLYSDFQSYECVEPKFTQKIAYYILEFLKKIKEKKGQPVKTAYFSGNTSIALYNFFFQYKYPLPLIRIYRRAARIIQENIKNGKSTFLITSSSPGALHIVGHLLKTNFNGKVSWVADFQDPLENDPILKTPDNLLLRFTDDLVFKNADIITTPSEAVMKILLKTAKSRGYNISSKIYLLPFGVIDIEPAISEKINLNPANIIYGGTIYIDRIEALTALLKSIRQINSYRFIYSGFTPEIAEELVIKAGIPSERYDIYGLLKKEEFENLIRLSSILLVLGTSNSFYRVLGSKAFELLKYNKPILIIAEENSDYYSILEQIKGVYWSKPEPKRIITTLRKIEGDIKTNAFLRSEEDLKPLLASQVALKFAEYLRGVKENA